MNIRRKKERLKKAFESKCDSFVIRFIFEDLDCEDVIAVTKSQCTKMAKAYDGLTIKMTKTQLAHNMKIEGGFLSVLSELISFLTEIVLPALGVGALSGLASTGVQN